MIEKTTLKSADRIITVSKPLAEDLSKLHSRNVYSITSGYDMREYPNSSVDGKFTILYPGTIHEERKKSVLKFAKSISMLKEKTRVNKESFEIKFYGRFKQWVMEIFKKYDIQDLASYNGFVSRAESLRQQKRSHCLLSLHSPNEKGIYGGKVFEYLGARRPIAAIRPPTVVSELLSDTEAGKSLYTETEIYNWVRKKFDMYQSDGSLGYNPSQSISNYSYKSTGKKFKDIVKNIV